MDLPRELKVEGVGTVTVDPVKDFLGKGGQAAVFKVGPDLVAKLFIDADATEKQEKTVLNPTIMTPDFVEKLKALMALKDPRIISPKGLVKNAKGTLLGYTMSMAKGVSLPEAFTNGFWRDNGWTNKEATAMAESMREIIVYAHAHQALVVDGNPANYIAIQDKHVWHPRTIDVDAWQIGRWPASAYHDLTRDPTSSTFTEGTDWFGLGTVLCQLLLNVHPYGGRLQGFKPFDIHGRMVAGKSIFTPGVQLGNGVRDMALIPPSFLKWMKDTYLDGARQPIPSLYATVPTVAVAARVARVVLPPVSGGIVYTKVFEVANDPVQRIYPSGVVRLRSGTLVYLGNKEVIGKAESPQAEVVRQVGGWLLADKVGGKLVFSWLAAGQSPQPITNLTVWGTTLVHAESGPQSDADRLFVADESGLQELTVIRMGLKALLGYGSQWPALTNSTRWFKGCGIQQTLGQVYLLLPYGPKQYTVLAVPELKGLTPLNALAGFGTVMVVAQDKKTGALTRFEFVLNPAHKAYTVTQQQVADADLNVTLRPDGTFRAIWDDGVFTASNPAQGQSRNWTDKGIRQDMVLATWAQTTIYEHDGAVWSIKSA